MTGTCIREERPCCSEGGVGVELDGEWMLDIYT